MSVTNANEAPSITSANSVSVPENTTAVMSVAAADPPFEMRGMKLCKFDKPLVQNHKLLKKIYWGQLEQDGDDPLANSSQQVRTAPE